MKNWRILDHDLYNVRLVRGIKDAQFREPHAVQNYRPHRFFRMWEDRVLVLVPLMLILQQAVSVRNVPTLNQTIVIICFVPVHLYGTV